MKLRNGLFLCLAASFFMLNPIQSNAAQISLALSSGIGIAASLDTVTVDADKIAETLDEVVKTNYKGMCIAHVNDYVNIRKEASEESEILGKLYNNGVGTVEGEENGWYLITSGNVHGYVKSDYVSIGYDAESIAAEVGTRVATVTTETLRVRKEATVDSPILGLIPLAEELTVLDETDTFVKVSIEEGDGWVSKDYVELRTDYTYAESKEEEEARLAKEAAEREAARRAAEEAAKKKNKKSKKSSSSNSSSSSVVGSGAGSASGNAVASFAAQFVGNPYVYGGTSLTNGADCSGFVMSVYRNFGISLPHSSSAMRSVGYGVSLSEAQPGDIICYSGHVGIYMGNNTLVHASTAKSGIKFTSPVTYKNVLAVRRIF